MACVWRPPERAAIYCCPPAVHHLQHAVPPLSPPLSPPLLQGLRNQMLSSLQQGGRGRQPDVLNGIAWDEKGRRLFVTGKLWPRLYQVGEQGRVQLGIGSCQARLTGAGRPKAHRPGVHAGLVAQRACGVQGRAAGLLPGSRVCCSRPCAARRGAMQAAGWNALLRRPLHLCFVCVHRAQAGTAAGGHSRQQAGTAAGGWLQTQAQLRGSLRRSGPSQVELVPLQTANRGATLRTLRQECIPKDTSLLG